jgi:hypothetical protein
VDKLRTQIRAQRTEVAPGSELAPDLITLYTFVIGEGNKLRPGDNAPTY